MSVYYPPPPGVDGRRRNGQPPPPSFSAPPPPPPQHPSHSYNYSSYDAKRLDDRDRARDRRDRDRDRYRDRDDRGRSRDDRSGRNDRDDRYQPSRRNDNYHELPPRPQDSHRESRGRNHGDSFRPPQGDFTFRADKPLGMGDSSNNNQNSYRPSDQNGASRAPYNGSSRPQGSVRGRGGLRGGRIAYSRRPWKPFKPSERALLQDNTAGLTTEDYADENNGPTYKALDELSDSDEADMDMSDSDNPSGEPTAKRARTTTKPDDGDSAPKWSNPDPYTALPPTEDADKKKKDVVQMIRKARIEASGGRTSLPAPGADQDFLRFDSDSDDALDDDEEFIDPLTYNRRQASTSSGAISENAANATSQVLHALPAKPGSASAFGPGQGASQTVHQRASNGQILKSTTVIDLNQSPAKLGRRAAHQAASVDLTPSSDLGSRKRTHDDELKLPAHARPKQVSHARANGQLLRDWSAKAGEPTCPWTLVATSRASINIRFHLEIKDFYDHLKPRQFEARIRAKLVDDLNQLVAQRLPVFRNSLMYPFGSYMSGLYLPTGDMDLALCSKAYINGGHQSRLSNNQMRKFATFIESQRLAVDNKVEAITRARVPLIKYVDKTTGLKVDVSFENNSGIIAVQTFKAWKARWPAMPIIVTLIKQFLLMRGLNEPVNGGIGGFSVTCMVVSMLQHMPPIQSGAMDQRHDLGSLLMHFFDLYGNRFQYKTVALSLNPPGYIPKSQIGVYSQEREKKISILDPNNSANDIAGGSSNFRQIAACFSQAHKLLQERLQRITLGEEFDSILSVVFGGDYSTFREQRDYLRKLSEITIPIGDMSPRRDLSPRVDRPGVLRSLSQTWSGKRSLPFSNPKSNARRKKESALLALARAQMLQARARGFTSGTTGAYIQGETNSPGSAWRSGLQSWRPLSNSRYPAAACSLKWAAKSTAFLFAPPAILYLCFTHS